MMNENYFFVSKGFFIDRFVFPPYRDPLGVRITRAMHLVVRMLNF